MLTVTFVRPLPEHGPVLAAPTAASTAATAAWLPLLLLQNYPAMFPSVLSPKTFFFSFPPFRFLAPPRTLCVSAHYMHGLLPLRVRGGKRQRRPHGELSHTPPHPTSSLHDMTRFV